MLMRQTLLYLPAQIMAPLVQFASILIWALLLTPADLGVLTLLTATQEICHAAFFGWWGMYTLRFIASFDQPDTRGVYLCTETVALIVSGLAESAVLLLIVPHIFGSTAITPSLICLSIIFMVSRSLNTYCSDRARAEARIQLYTLVQTVGPVTGFLFGLLCIWLIGPSPHAVLAGFIFAQLIGLGMSIAMSDIFRRIGPVSVSVLKTAVSFGGTQTTSQMLAVLAMNAPRFIVNRELGLAAAGMFSVGYSLGMRASSFAVTLVTAGAYPLVVRKMQTEGREAAFAQLSQNMVLVALVVAPVALGLFAINRSLIDLMVAEPFRAVTYTVLPLATLGGLFRYLRAHTSDQVFLLNLKPEFGTIIAACDICVAVASAYVGVRLLGAAGGALGPMISGLATFTLSFILSRTRFGYHAPLVAFSRVLAAAALMCAVIIQLPVARNLILLAAYVAFGGVIYVALVTAFMPKERATLRRLTVRLLQRIQGVRRA